MTHEYLIGELSARLERLQQAAEQPAAGDVARLRNQVETGSLAVLPSATEHALALADGLCWDSLSRGDTGAFARQAGISAELLLFGICARLLEGTALLPEPQDRESWHEQR
jgi:hypothetical protein